MMGGGLVAIRSNWTKDVQRVEWPNVSVQCHELLLTAAPPGLLLSVLSPLRRPVGVHAFPKGDGFEKLGAIGTLSWLPNQVVGCARDANGTITLLRANADGPPLIDHYSADGTLRSSIGVMLAEGQVPVPVSTWADSDEDVTVADASTWDTEALLTGRSTVPFVVQGGVRILAMGNQLILCHPPNDQFRSIALPRRIVALSATHQAADKRVAVGFSKGGLLFDFDSAEVIAPFLPEEPYPSFGFTRDGHFIALGDTAAVIAPPQTSRFRDWIPAKLPRPGFLPQTRLLNLLPAIAPDSFALVTSDGIVSVYSA